MTRGERKRVSLREIKQALRLIGNKMVARGYGREMRLLAIKGGRQ